MSKTWELFSYQNPLVVKVGDVQATTAFPFGLQDWNLNQSCHAQSNVSQTVQLKLSKVSFSLFPKYVIVQSQTLTRL
jgi:hypothetical protein